MPKMPTKVPKFNYKNLRNLNNLCDLIAFSECFRDKKIVGLQRLRAAPKPLSPSGNR